MNERVKWATVGRQLGTMRRTSVATDSNVDRVTSIIADVRERGDDALRDLARRFDGVDLEQIEVPTREIRSASRDLDAGVRGALEEAAGAIEAFHRAQARPILEMETHPGVRIGRKSEPLRRVGVYAPGGRAAYASSVLMGVIPAKIAGVDEVVVCSPPGPDGLPPKLVLAAAELSGADAVYAIGGAGAIAAFAYGTATVKPVDKVVGPGNVYVTEAKRQLNGVIAIDGPAGPSEILVIADGAADPRLIAGELLAQAEHDPEASCILISPSKRLLKAVRATVDELVAELSDSATARAALAARGALLEVDDLDQAYSFSEAFAPEHLMIATANPRDGLSRVRCAGTVFLGQSSSVVFGDYVTGANHVLPTGGLARAYSGLSTSDFQREFTYQEVTPMAAARLSRNTGILAEAEGLPAHAQAARLRADLPDADASGPHRSNTSPGRAALREVELYDPMRAPAEVDLSANTNLFPEDSGVRRAIALASPDRIAKYPGVYTDELVRALAAYHGVAPENVVVGCGSDDLIDSAMRAFADPGAVVAFPDPTFGMIPVFTKMNAAVPNPVPLLPDFELDVDGMLRVRAQIQYVCSPNNPTGTLASEERLLRLAADGAGVTLLDEAYADFSSQDLSGAAAESDRLIVLRTFSKASGLAGLRIGYAIGPTTLIAEIQKSRGPYKVGALAEAAALHVLGSGLERVRCTVELTRQNRQRLTDELELRGFEPLPSSSNFLLIPVGGAPARDWATALRAGGVEVRPFGGLTAVGEALRVTVGPWPLMVKFLETLDGVSSGYVTAARSS